MKIDTLGGILDKQLLYDALVEIKGRLPNPTRRFLIWTLRAEIRSLRRTLKYIEKELDAISPRKKTSA